MAPSCPATLLAFSPRTGAQRHRCSTGLIASFVAATIRSCLLMTVAPMSLVAPGIDPACWDSGFFSESCCIGEAGQSQCWDSNFNFERCCGGVDRTPESYETWLAGYQYVGNGFCLNSDGARSPYCQKAAVPEKQCLRTCANLTRCIGYQTYQGYCYLSVHEEQTLTDYSECRNQKHTFDITGFDADLQAHCYRKEHSLWYVRENCPLWASIDWTPNPQMDESMTNRLCSEFNDAACYNAVCTSGHQERWEKLCLHRKCPEASPLQHKSDTFELCSEFVRRFDFEDPDQERYAIFERCVRERLTLARSAFRPAALSGQHFPTLLSPGPEGLMFALPAFDFVVSKHIKKYGTYDPEELRLYKAFLPSGGTLIDVGANVGGYAIPLALHVGQEGLVLAVEPFRATFQMLTANSAINGFRNLRTRQVGLGGGEERVRMRSPSLTKANNVGMARVFRPFEEAYAENFMYRSEPDEETIHVTTLDKLVDEEELQQLSVLKVDVEGHLKAVLLGGDATLRRFHPILVAEHSEDDSLDWLQLTYGYDCQELLPKHDTWVCLPDARQWEQYHARMKEVS